MPEPGAERASVIGPILVQSKPQNLGRMRGLLAAAGLAAADLTQLSYGLTRADVNKITLAIVEKFNLTSSYGDHCNAKVKPCSNGDNMGELPTNVISSYLI
jgi:hypothetical protein